MNKIIYLIANSFLYIGKFLSYLSLKLYNTGLFLHIKFNTKYKQKILSLKKELENIDNKQLLKFNLEKDPLIISNKHGNA